MARLPVVGTVGQAPAQTDTIHLPSVGVVKPSQVPSGTLDEQTTDLEDRLAIIEHQLYGGI